MTYAAVEVSDEDDEVALGSAVWIEGLEGGLGPLFVENGEFACFLLDLSAG